MERIVEGFCWWQRLGCLSGGASSRLFVNWRCFWLSKAFLDTDSDEHLRKIIYSDKLKRTLEASFKREIDTYKSFVWIRLIWTLIWSGQWTSRSLFEAWRDSTTCNECTVVVYRLVLNSVLCHQDGNVSKYKIFHFHMVVCSALFMNVYNYNWNNNLRSTLRPCIAFKKWGLMLVGTRSFSVWVVDIFSSCLTSKSASSSSCAKHPDDRS